MGRQCASLSIRLCPNSQGNQGWALFSLCTKVEDCLCNSDQGGLKFKIDWGAGNLNPDGPCGSEF